MPAKTIILSSIENSNSQGSFKTTSGSRRPSVSEKAAHTVSTYFYTQLQRSKRRAVTDFRVPCSTIRKGLKKIIHMLPYKRRTFNELKNKNRRLNSTSCFYSVVH